jgi:hypothetical protein
MVATTQVRKVPYTVQRPITETITRKVPVQQQRWVSEERVRKVPVQTTRTVYETRKEPVEVKYYEQEAVTRTVMKPVTRQKYVPYTETIMVPKQMVQRVPLSYTDPFGPAVLQGYPSFASPITPSTPTPAITPDSGAASSLGDSILQPNSTVAVPANSAPRTRMQKIEISEPESVSDFDGDPIEEKVEIEEELLPPKQGSGDDSTEKAENDAASIKGSKAGWKIQWNPLSAREA